MKRPIIAGLLVGAPAGAFVGAFYSDDTTTNVIAGIVFGIVTALAIGAYVVRSDRRWKQRRARVLAEFEPEGIVHHGDAAVGSMLAAGVAAAVVGPVLGSTGGWLVLTTKRLVFIPHQRGFLAKRTELEVAEIAGAKRGEGLNPNTISVFTAANFSVQLTVRRPDEWIAKLPGPKALGN